jgi:hypothetical protein
MENFKTGEWVLLSWKKNQELGIITNVYTETNTVHVSVNPYKFGDINTVINFKDVIKLSELQEIILKQIIEGIKTNEKNIKTLKGNIDIIPKLKSVNHKDL